jgi:hypothetical protein
MVCGGRPVCEVCVCVVVLVVVVVCVCVCGVCGELVCKKRRERVEKPKGESEVSNQKEA